MAKTITLQKQHNTTHMVVGKPINISKSSVTLEIEFINFEKWKSADAIAQVGDIVSFNMTYFLKTEAGESLNEVITNAKQI